MTYPMTIASLNSSGKRLNRMRRRGRKDRDEGIFVQGNSVDTFSIYETRFILIFYVLCGSFVFFSVSRFGISKLQHANSILDWIAFFGVALTALFTALVTMAIGKKVFRPRPVAEFNQFGFILEGGVSYEWHQVSRIYIWTGVLFFTNQDKTNWILRLDPAEVGYKRVRQLREFLKATAPPNLTSEI